MKTFKCRYGNNRAWKPGSSILKEKRNMERSESEAIVAICLMAALVDGEKGEAERAQIKEIVESLGGVGEAGVYQRVLLKRTSLAQEAALIADPDVRSLAYEMAVSVCDADDVLSPAESEFLNQLKAELTLSPQSAAALTRQAEEIAAIPVDRSDLAPASMLPVETRPVPPIHVQTSGPADAEVDKTVLNYAIVTAALELLPQSLSTLAIIPLQMKMVYGVGEKFGHTLDRGHIKEFLATVGVGMTGQVLENVARKFLGKFIGKAAGKTVGNLAGAAAGPALTFATTYALGMVAKRYYAAGRTFSTADLRNQFSGTVEQAKGLYDQYRPQVESSAKSLNITKVLDMVRAR